MASSLTESKLDNGSQQIVMGIDPGTNIMGYGILGVSGKKLEIISIGVIKLDKLDNHALKLQKIFERVSFLIDTYSPDEVALEAPFFGKNVQSMLKLGRAQGVAMAAALSRQIPIQEYAPRKIKQAITGNGNASKEQVAGMLHHILQFEEQPSYMDATDALAVALCHVLQQGGTGKAARSSVGESLGNRKKKKKDSWQDFLKNNPDRKL